MKVRHIADAAGHLDKTEPLPCHAVQARDIPEWEAWGGAGYSVQDTSQRAVQQSGPPKADLARLDLGEMQGVREQARMDGVAEGRRLEREEQAAASQANHEQFAARLAQLTASFAEARDHFLHTVEEEVVRLALAIAARILRREAQMDPLLLSGAVRVAFGQLAASTTLRLHVPPAEVALWREWVALLPNLAVKPQVEARDGMLLGDCVVETQMGTVDLGVRAQLSEIERGFFDRSAVPAASRTHEVIR